jgi:hypothetical protein
MLADIWSLIFEHLPMEYWPTLFGVERSAYTGFNRFINRRLSNRQCVCCGENLHQHHHVAEDGKDGQLKIDWCRVEAFHDTSSCIPLHLPPEQQAGWWLCFQCHRFFYQCPDCQTFCRLIEHPGKPLFGHDFFRMTEANDFNEERLYNFNSVALSEYKFSSSSTTAKQATSDQHVYYFVSDFRWPLSIVRVQNGKPLHNRQGYYVGDRSDPFLDTMQWFPYELCRDDESLEARVRYVDDEDEHRSWHVWKCPCDDRIFKFCAKK